MADDFILSIWSRLLQSDAGAIPPEAASYFLRLRLPAEDRERMEELAQKSGEGTLTSDERTELETYSHASAFLTIIQSRARSSLRSSVPVSGNGTPAA